MINYNPKLINEWETQVTSPPCTVNIKIVSISFMLFYVHYLKLQQLLTGLDSKFNLVAIDILTLYALIHSSFWFQTGPLYKSGVTDYYFQIKLHFLKIF